MLEIGIGKMEFGGRGTPDQAFPSTTLSLMAIDFNHACAGM